MESQLTQTIEKDIETPVESQLSHKIKRNSEEMRKTKGHNYEQSVKALERLHQTNEMIDKLRAMEAKTLPNTPGRVDTRTTSSENETPGGRAKWKIKKRKSRTRK